MLILENDGFGDSLKHNSYLRARLVCLRFRGSAFGITVVSVWGGPVPKPSKVC